MIEVKNLVKKYGEQVAVDHLDFRLEPGRIYGFLGPNGAGKSTTMNMMTGYLGATEGTIEINGHDILKEPEAAKRHIGYLPEIPPLYTDMTVSEYLYFAAELKGIAKKEWEKAVQEVMQAVRLEEVQMRLIRNLSKGYRQRVGLAQALLGFPEILILDEPMVGLDPKQIIEIRELIRGLGNKHTVILSSHILAEVREICDYILIISRGKLVAGDTPENLEHLLNGQNTLELEAKAGLEETRDILKKVPEIIRAQMERTEEGTVFAKVHTEPAGKNGLGKKTDVREKIFFAFSEAACPLLLLKPSKASLEEVFMQLTQGGEQIQETGSDASFSMKKKEGSEVSYVQEEGTEASFVQEGEGTEASFIQEEGQLEGSGIKEENKEGGR